MTRLDLINILNRKIPDNFKISDKSESNEKTSSIYIGRYSERLKSYTTILKCFTYSSNKKSGWKEGEKITWYFDFYMDNDNRRFLIPDKQTEDFIELFLYRYCKYLDIKDEYSKIFNSIFILSNGDRVKSEIRDFKIKNVIKSENQE